MRLLICLPALLIAAACGPKPTANPPDGGSEPTPATGEARCPAADEPCMNADNHAACLEVAATCEGEIVQLESCPLQFACADGDTAGGPDDAGGEAYDPCAGKACGDGCSVCPPDDADCVETAVVKMCDADGKCAATAPTCE